jgi:hypothetical protein
MNCPGCPSLDYSIAAFQVGPDAPPYAGNIIISPHIYPASVIPRGCTGKGLCNRLSNSWGYLSVKVACTTVKLLSHFILSGTLRSSTCLPRAGVMEPVGLNIIGRQMKHAASCAGVLQWRALPPVPGAGRRDRQPAARLPQPLQQPGAEVHGA